MDIDLSAEPNIGMLTDNSAVVLCDQPLVPLSNWFLGILHACAKTGRRLYLVTPPTSRLTLPTVSVLLAATGRWVVHDHASAQYYDGLWGPTVAWRDGVFEPTEVAEEEQVSVSERFRAAAPPTGRQLRLCFEVQHAASRWTTLGGAVEALCRAFGGAPPAGWGPAEPVTRLWRASELTAFAREQAPTSCAVILVGGGDRPCVGTLEVTRTPGGVSETAELVFGYPRSEQAPVERLRPTIDTLACAHNLSWLYAETRLARADLTRPAHAEGLPIPVGLAVGSEVPPPSGAESGPVPYPIGRSERPTVWYELSEGDSLAGWTALSRVIQPLFECEVPTSSV